MLTGQGEKAFCAGGDQKVRGDYGGYQDDSAFIILTCSTSSVRSGTCPKPVVAMVAGYSHRRRSRAAYDVRSDYRGGKRHLRPDRAKSRLFRRRLGRLLYGADRRGRKSARNSRFLCRQYDAQQALDMGLVNTVVPLADLEKETVRWCREMLQNSPMALRCRKAALNADCDGQAGLQELAGNATMLFYMTEEGAGRTQRLQPETSAGLQANLNGIHNARFAGLPLADTDGRGRGAARAAVQKPATGCSSACRRGTRRLGRNFSPAGIQCRDAGRGANGAVSVGHRPGATAPSRRSHAALRRVWHQLRAGGAWRRLPQAADYRAAPLCSAIRMSYSPDWRRCPGEKVAKVKVGLWEAVRDGMVVNLLLEAIPDLQLRPRLQPRLDAAQSATVRQYVNPAYRQRIAFLEEPLQNAGGSSGL